MSRDAKQPSHGGYYLSVDVDEEKYDGAVCDGDGEPVFALRRRAERISGVQKRHVPHERSWLQVDRKIVPKHFVLMIRYHYPLVNFPQQLKEEFEAIEEFFGIQQRGEGSTVHEGRMIATLSYRLAGDIGVVRNFNNTIKGLLERYGAETLGHKISRT